MPSPALLARWAVQLAPVALPAAQRLYEQGRFRQLALMHARTLVDGAFSSEFVDGQRVWVVWAGDEPVTTYPEVGAVDLVEELASVRDDHRKDPDELPTARLRARLRAVRTRRTGELPDAEGWEPPRAEELPPAQDPEI